MKLSKKLLVSILATASLFGVSLASQNSHQANASMRHYTRYINGKYNAYHNVPGRRNAYLMHYGHNYRNDRVSTYGTYYKFGRHYTKINRARRWFGYMNVKGLNTRPIRVRVRKHAYRRPARRNYRKPIRRATHRIYHKKSNAKYFQGHKITADTMYPHPKNESQYYANGWGKYQHKGELTSKGLQIADKDAINDLNQIRESKGIQPLTQNPKLQYVAQQRLGQWNLQKNGHWDKYTGKLLNGEDAAKDGFTSNGKYEDIYGENVGYTNEAVLESPSDLAKFENNNWDIGHKQNRENPEYSQVGIAMNNNSHAIEEFY